MTQHTSGEAVTAVTNCFENCVETSGPQQWVINLPFFGASRTCGPVGWLALLITKAGDIETNPGPTTVNKRVWICDIYHKQIHVRKRISIRCNRIEHWVHLRCAGIRQAQYTDTWTCHLHSESRLTPHTSYRHNTTPPLPTMARALYPLPTYTTYTSATKTDTRPTLLLSPHDW